MEWVKKTAKAWSAPIAAVIGWVVLVTDSPSASITSAEWVALVIALAGSFGIVYSVPNKGA